MAERSEVIEPKPVFGSPLPRRRESSPKGKVGPKFPEETQLVMDPAAYEAVHVNRELVRRPAKEGSKREQGLARDINRVRWSKAAQPNPHERTGR